MTAASGPSRGALIAGFATIYLVWGSTYLAIRLTSADGIPPLVMCALRFLIAGPVMLAGCAVFGRSIRIAPRDAILRRRAPHTRHRKQPHPRHHQTLESFFHQLVRRLMKEEKFKDYMEADQLM